MPFVPRKSWNEVYKNQNILLGMLKEVDGIFLGGGTAIQRFTSSFKARESDDLDFFIAAPDATLAAKKAIEIRKKLELNQVVIENYVSHYGTHRFICKLKNSDERVKIELLDCTTDRFGGEFISSIHYPRIENSYDLILYKLKALHDRQDTIKDLFDLYFLFKEYNNRPISQKKLFMDLQMKFEVSTGYVYSENNIIDALHAKSRQWDIVLCSFENIQQYEIKDAIEQFRKAFLIQIKDSNIEHFHLGYQYATRTEPYMKIQDFYEFIEPNTFITYGYEQYLKVTTSKEVEKIAARNTEGLKLDDGLNHKSIPKLS